MATPSYSELKSLAFDRAGINVTTDAPIDDTTFARYVNDALRDVWEMSGGRIKIVASATAWTNANSATGVVTGILTDIAEVRHVWASTVSGSVGVSSGDVELDIVDFARIQYLRSASGLPTYATTVAPKECSISRLATSTPASVNLVRLDYFPGNTGFYMPIAYLPQFAEIDSATVTTPDMDDILARDGGLMCAARLCQIVDRMDLVPGIMADISQRTQEAMARKRSAQVDARQDMATR